jgi:outer membrane protein OmpA-like peptidoglycan-associated protein/tetratricopeptide (TPR) repeat protein
MMGNFGNCMEENLAWGGGLRDLALAENVGGQRPAPEASVRSAYGRRPPLRERSPLLIFVFLIAFGWMGAAVYAQGPSFKKADQYFEAEAYPSAIRLYVSGLEKNFDQRAAERLAKCYQNIGRSEEATKWYAQAITKTTSAAVAWDYAQVLKSGGHYAEAASMFDRYGELSQKYDEARLQAEACERAEQIKGDGKGWKVNATDLNSSASDFGPWIAGNKLIYVSARKRGFFTRVLNLRNDNLFYDIYAAEIKGPVTFGRSKLQKGSLKTRYHDGPVALSKDLNAAYFTRSNIKKGKLKRDQQERAHLQLFSAQLIRGKKYKKEMLLSFNGDGYSTGHPALSADGQTMVFASDIPGGQGGSDLYITHLEKGNWSTPINLGKDVNTLGDELFPAIAGNGMLFFASDGHPGLGGLDIFFGYALPDGKWGNVQNPGAPLNSPRDDFSMVWDNRGQGYFSSNRAGGKGDDDIYQFSRVIPLDIQITDINSGAPVADAQVKMLSSTGAEVVLKSDASGKASTYIDWGKSYKFAFAKTGYNDETQTLDFDPEKSAGGRKVEVQLYKYPVASVDGSAMSSLGGPIADAKVRTVGEQREIPFTSDGKGKFAGTVDTASIYTAIVQKDGFQPGIAEFNTNGMVMDATFPVWVTMQPGNFVLYEGVTVDHSTGAKLAGTHVRAVNATDSLLSGPVKSRKDGKFWLSAPSKIAGDLLASRDGYFTSRFQMPDSAGRLPNTTVPVTIELVPAKVGELVKIIYYDYRESFLTSKAKKELEEIVYFLLDNPTAVVELSSHTDSRGTDAYNLTLSEARAKAAVDYVISKGVGSSRIVAKGYGRSVLVNGCVEGKECLDSEHALNRRTEVRVIAVK